MSLDHLAPDRVEEILRAAAKAIAEHPLSPAPDDAPPIAELFSWAALLGSSFSSFAKIAERTKTPEGKALFRALKRVNSIVDSCDLLPVISLLVDASYPLLGCSNQDKRERAFLLYEAAIALVSSTILVPKTRLLWMDEATRKFRQACNQEEN